MRNTLAALSALGLAISWPTSTFAGDRIEDFVRESNGLQLEAEQLTALLRQCPITNATERCEQSIVAASDHIQKRLASYKLIHAQIRHIAQADSNAALIVQRSVGRVMRAVEEMHATAVRVGRSR